MNTKEKFRELQHQIALLKEENRKFQKQLNMLQHNVRWRYL